MFRGSIIFFMKVAKQSSKTPLVVSTRYAKSLLYVIVIQHNELQEQHIGWIECSVISHLKRLHVLVAFAIHSAK